MNAAKSNNSYNLRPFSAMNVRDHPSSLPPGLSQQPKWTKKELTPSLIKSSDTGNRTLVSRVTGGDTNHYTISDVCLGRGVCWCCALNTLKFFGRLMLRWHETANNNNMVVLQCKYIWYGMVAPTTTTVPRMVGGMVWWYHHHNIISDETLSRFDC